MMSTMLILGGFLMMLSVFYEHVPIYQQSLRIVAVCLQSAIPISTKTPPDMIEQLHRLH